jgi:phage shock protein E
MDWRLLLAVGFVVLVIVGLRRLAFVPLASARLHLAAGAVIVDVRSPGEFHRDHVSGAVNVPLDELAPRITAAVPDKQRVLLVHCLSGGRSAIARQQLRALGYPRVFNLGSLARARKLIALPK